MSLLWAPFTRPSPQDTISLSYSHRILQGVLDFSLSQEHIPPAHPPKHALKSRDALPVNHTSHEAVGRRGIWGPLAHATARKALRQRREARGEGHKQQTQDYAMLRQKGSQSLIPRPRRGLTGQLRNCIQSDLGTPLKGLRREHILGASELARLTALLNSKNEPDPSVPPHHQKKACDPTDLWSLAAVPTRALTVCLFPSHSAPRGMRTLPTGLDPPSADDAIQPEFTNQLISNENS